MILFLFDEKCETKKEPSEKTTSANAAFEPLSCSLRSSLRLLGNASLFCPLSPPPRSCKAPLAWAKMGIRKLD
jgi:hypothetical protein